MHEPYSSFLPQTFSGTFPSFQCPKALALCTAGTFLSCKSLLKCWLLHRDLFCALYLNYVPTPPLSSFLHSNLFPPKNTYWVNLCIVNTYFCTLYKFIYSTDTCSWPEAESKWWILFHLVFVEPELGISLKVLAGKRKKRITSHRILVKEAMSTSCLCVVEI